MNRVKCCKTCKFWYKNPATVNDVGYCRWREGMPEWFNSGSGDGHQINGDSGRDCDVWESGVYKK